VSRSAVVVALGRTATYDHFTSGVRHAAADHVGAIEPESDADGHA
jgi:hypothetical protein